MPAGRAGQTETSFQWVFVLIAGIALLLLFLMLVRGVSRTGEEQATAGDLRAAASLMASLAWEGSSVRNVTLPEARVACRAGALTLEAGTATVGVDSAPIYLPPTVGGRARIVTRDLALGDGTPAPFPFGGVAYALDARTAYLIVEDQRGLGDSLIRDLPDANIARVQVDDLDRPGALAGAVQGTPRTIVLVIVGTDADLARANISGLPATADVRGVALQPRSERGGVATFFARDAGRLAPVGGAPYAHDRIGVGMVIAADRDAAWCATDVAAERARAIVAIAAVRAGELSPEVADPACGALLGQAADLLDAVASRAGTGAFLDALVGAEPDIIALQGNLLTRPGDCPGVA